jgi:DNA polymerase-4
VHGQYQINLFDDTEEQVKFYQAMDKLKNKYGERIVSRAVGLQK